MPIYWQHLYMYNSAQKARTLKLSTKLHVSIYVVHIMHQIWLIQLHTTLDLFQWPFSRMLPY